MLLNYAKTSCHSLSSYPIPSASMLGRVCACALNICPSKCRNVCSTISPLAHISLGMQATSDAVFPASYFLFLPVYLQVKWEGEVCVSALGGGVGQRRKLNPQEDQQYLWRLAKGTESRKALLLPSLLCPRGSEGACLHHPNAFLSEENFWPLLCLSMISTC